MPGNDERDRLDSWLGQQVRPMPPPPGTFELITRRARRRKLRKLAVTVVSAAAVAAGVAVAVPNVLALRVTPNSVAIGEKGNQTSTTPTRGTQSPNGSATHAPSPTPSQSQSSSASSNGLRPVPANFQPSSVTFDSTETGWVIGQAGTPGTCANVNPYICTSIARTDDAGQTWQGGPAPNTGAPNGATGVSGIRFLDGVNGWAFGPELWSTHDRGNTWNQVAVAKGFRVTDLETAGSRAFALFASCNPTPGIAQFNWDCTHYTLMTTTKDSDNWGPVGDATNGLANRGLPSSAVIALTSTTGYLLAPDGTLFSGPLDGPWQRVATAPCQPGPGQANGQPVHALLGLVDSTDLALTCTGFVGVATQVYTSNDSGALWTQVASPGNAEVMSLTASPAGTIVLGVANGIEVLPAGSSQWQQATVTGAPSGGFSYVGMTSGNQGVALPVDVKLHEIWMTFNGGLDWSARTPIIPGS